MIVVTAPTSTIGRQVLDGLIGRGEAVRVVARDPQRLSPQVRDQVEVVQGSHRDSDVIHRAFAGADAVFWLVPADPQAPSADAAYADFSQPTCAAFVQAGIKRVVGIRRWAAAWTCSPGTSRRPSGWMT